MSSVIRFGMVIPATVAGRECSGEVGSRLEFGFPDRATWPADTPFFSTSAMMKF